MKKNFLMLSVILTTIFNLNDFAQTNETAIVIGDEWGILEGENQGNPMFIRKNYWCDRLVGNDNWPLRAGIAFRLLNPDGRGLPTNKEATDLWALEDTIFEELQNDTFGIITIIITTSGFREFVLYVKDAEAFKSRVEIIQKQHENYQLTTYVELDPTWELYQAY
jgi:hypothetical protein